MAQDIGIKVGLSLDTTQGTKEFNDWSNRTRAQLQKKPIKVNLQIDGQEYEKTFKLNQSFEDNKMFFYAEENINSGIILDDLDCGEYYMFLRLKLNNSIDPRYYSLRKHSNFKNIEYYSMTKDGKNKKIEISYEEKAYKENNFDILKLVVTEVTLPENVYDIVIDAGHGGTDSGEKLNGVTESDLTLKYAKRLKEQLEEKGYKVKLTRDDSNTNSYTYTNMYDADGRIGIACSSKAKLMISLHINNAEQDKTGFEIYSPTKSNLNFAKNMSKKIKGITIEIGGNTTGLDKALKGVNKEICKYDQQILIGENELQLRFERDLLFFRILRFLGNSLLGEVIFQKDQRKRYNRKNTHHRDPFCLIDTEHGHDDHREDQCHENTAHHDRGDLIEYRKASSLCCVSR